MDKNNNDWWWLKTTDHSSYTDGAYAGQFSFRCDGGSFIQPFGARPIFCAATSSGKPRTYYGRLRRELPRRTLIAALNGNKAKMQRFFKGGNDYVI